MWSAEHSVETSASAEAVWGLWADMPSWPEWNADLARAELEGDFAVGGTIRMTSLAGDVVELRIVETREPELFVDEADLGNIVVRTAHRLEPSDAGHVRIVYRMEIDGPEAHTVGPSSVRRSAATSRTCSPPSRPEPNRPEKSPQR